MTNNSFNKLCNSELIKNENEKLVFEYINELIEKNSLPCACQDCLLDIAILTLNSLPPQYFVDQGFETVFVKSKEKQLEFLSLLKEKVRKAVEIVEKRPHH